MAGQKRSVLAFALALALAAASAGGPREGYSPRHSLFDWKDIPAFFKTTVSCLRRPFQLLTPTPGFSTCVAVADSNTPETAASYTALAERMVRTRTLKGLILGGSATAGVDCHDDDGYILKQCSWGGRVTRWLEAEYPDIQVTINNQASGGTTIIAALPSLFHFLEPDIIFADFVVNDAIEGDQSGLVDGNLLIKYGACAARPAAAVSSHRASCCSEAFVLQVKRERPQAMLVFVVSVPFSSTVGECLSVGSSNDPKIFDHNPRFEMVGDIVRWVSALHGVSYINYYDVAECATSLVDNAGMPTDTTYKYWVAAAGPHPNAYTHQLIADTITATLHGRIGPLPAGEASAAGHPPPAVVQTLANLSILAKLELCITPTAYFSAPDAFQQTGGTTRGVSMGPGVSLTEDRAGKPGWILSAADSWLTFEVTFGRRPRLMVVFLKSYENMGNVTMALNGRNVTLSGLYDAFDSQRNRVSQLHEQTFQVERNDDYWLTHHEEQGFSGVIGFAVQPNSKHNVTFAGIEQGGSHKFKVVVIAAC